MLPFSRDQFLAVFADYNQALWPGQIAAYGLALAMLAAIALSPLSRTVGRLAAAGLAAGWLVTGIGYHGLYFSAINPAAFLFGALFVLQAGLLIGHGVVAGSLRLQFGREPGGLLGGVLVAYAMAIYPLTGHLSGHDYPAAPTFGVTPCPLTLFSLGVLLLARPPAPRMLLAIPLLWALIGGAAAVMLDMPQDWILPAAAALGVLGARRRSEEPI